jgi:hypothetical protein
MITGLCRGARMSEEQTRLDVCHRKVNLTLSGQIRPGEWRDVTGRLRNIFSDATRVKFASCNMSCNMSCNKTWPNPVRALVTSLNRFLLIDSFTMLHIGQLQSGCWPVTRRDSGRRSFAFSAALFSKVLRVANLALCLIQSVL